MPGSPKLLITALVPVLLLAGDVRAATKKAVLIGINIYNPSAEQQAELSKTPIAHTYARKPVPGGWAAIPFKNLDGAVADAELMKGILSTSGFTDIATLYNQDATADRILATLDRYLIKEANPGDVRFVYYSGHGNYANNKATKDQDETMVPADHWRDVPDIRDKELSRILYAAGKKGVIVTMVADSCHSGSLSRGVWDDVGTSKTASGEFTPIEVNDAPDLDDKGKPIDPKNQNVLFISAAQRNEEALEYSSPEGAHGAFTWAFRQALIQGPNQRVDLIYQRTLAYLKAEGKPQVPVLDASAERLKRGVLGETVDQVQGLVVTVDTVGAYTMLLRGGSAMGIYPGCELIRVDKKKPAVRIRVTKPLTAASSEAVVAEPADAVVSAADQFQVDKYVVPEGAMLRVYFPKPAPARTLTALAAEAAKLSPAITVLEDSTQARPTHVISWDGSGWILETHPAKGKIVPLGADFNADAIRRSVPAGSKLLLILPPSPELTASLPLGKSENTSIQVQESVRGADYLLEGRSVKGHIEYAWVLPDSTEDSVREQAGGAAKNQGMIALPLRSDWTALADNADDTADRAQRTADILTDQALRLGRIRAWLSLLTPPDAKGSSFPYHLALQDVSTKKLVTSGDLKGGARFKIMLEASDADLKKINYTVPPRFVYVFAVDHFGRGSLLFPVLGHGNEGNHIPVGSNAKNRNESVNVASLVKAGQHVMTLSPPEVEYDFDVTEPFGVDTYLLLTSEQPVDNPEVFEFDGVRSKGESRGVPSGNPLTALLSDVGSGTRAASANRPVPTDWALERLTLRSVK